MKILALSKLALAIEEYGLIRRTLVIGNFALVWIVIWWSFEFAKMSKFDGTGTAAIIGAITLPLSWLTKEVFGMYNAFRAKAKENGG